MIMEVSSSTFRNLLNDTTRIVEHQKEIAFLKGENFNVFSILKMEYRENETHSAFLGELLSPKGSHGLGSIFLECFLTQLGIQHHIDIGTAEVILEKHISKHDDLNASGGRIDIFICDSFGKSVCIENKIQASDQNAQIARYCNFNTEKNKVYYLTLEGEIPSIQSRSNKIIDQDFFTLSYKDEILEWLEQCQKEATQFPILRESINQYTILIKKLTNQLSNYKMEQEVKEIIKANYQAATIIGSNIWKVELEYTEQFISDIAIALKGSLSDDFTIKSDNNLTKSYTGISIRNKHWPHDIIVRLEGNSKIPWSTSYYGIVADKNKFDRAKIKEALSAISLLQSGFKETSGWPFYKVILDLSTTEKRARLFTSAERAVLVKEITEMLEELSHICEKPLANSNLAV